jgi:hypothetical protein
MWPTWQTGVEVAIVLAIVHLVLSVSGRGRTEPTSRAAAAISATAREAAIVFGLYALWQWAHEVSVTKTAGALTHAQELYDFEHRIHLPDELTLQHLVLPHKLLVEFFNGYYAVVHAPALVAMLIWLFAWHRGKYPPVRNVIALVTGACLLIQTIPLAPPRFLPNLGFVDTGLLYNQSVYGRGGSGVSNQVAAMPSIHVAWALVVGIVVIQVSRSRWRWWVLAHPVLTVLAVTVTANHWWMDGIVAGILLALAFAIVYGTAFAFGRIRPRPEPVPAPVPTSVL